MRDPALFLPEGIIVFTSLLALLAYSKPLQAAEVTLFFDGTDNQLGQFSEIAIDAHDQLHILGDRKLAVLSPQGQVVRATPTDQLITIDNTIFQTLLTDNQENSYFRTRNYTGHTPATSQPVIFRFDATGQLQGMPTPFDDSTKFEIDRWDVTPEGTLVMLVRHASGLQLVRYSPELQTLITLWESTDRLYSVSNDLRVGKDGNVYLMMRPRGSGASTSPVDVFMKITPQGGVQKLSNIDISKVDFSMPNVGAFTVNAFGELLMLEHALNYNWRGFKRNPNGLTQQIIDVTGDGTGAVTTTIEGTFPHFIYRHMMTGNPLVHPVSGTTDALGNFYIAGLISDNVFKVSREGSIRQIVNVTGNGLGASLNEPLDLEVDSQGNLYVLANNRKIFRVTADAFNSTTRYLASLQLSSENRQLPDETQIVYGDDAANMLDIRTSSAAVMGLGGDDTVLAGNKYHVVYGGEGKDDVQYKFDLQDYALSQDPLTGDTEVIGKSGDSLGLVAGDVETLKFRDTEVANSQLGYWGSTFNVTQSANAPVFRFFNVANKSYFYTTSEAEAESILANSSELQDSAREWPYVYQGATFAPARQHEGAVALHRFFNTLTGHHFFTANEQEVAFVQQQMRDAGWPFAYEGIAFNVYPEDPTPGEDGEDVPVHRFYSTSLNRHVFTASLREALLFQESRQWQYDGIGFYAERVQLLDGSR